MGDFRSMDPIFKGCYGDSFLYPDTDLGSLRWQEIHLPPYRGENPTPPSPSYLQAKQSEAMKWSPPQAMTPTMIDKSPKTRSMDPIFKGCYGDSFLYPDTDLGSLRWQEIHLPPYRGENPTPPSPSYLQAKQSKAMKWSPPQAMTPTMIDKSPKTRCSDSKGRHHHSLGCSLNSALTLPQPRSLPVPRSQSQRNRTSFQESWPSQVWLVPFPSAKLERHKWKEAHTEDTHELNSTLPVSSSGFDGFRRPMEFQSKATELHPPSITSTPLGLGAPQQWRSVLEESHHLLASLHTSPGSNLPGQPVAGLSNLTPSSPSLAGSHQVSSTWPTGILTPGLSSPHLTIDQANSVYKLAAECQALGIKLTKKFQVLSGLEAIHRNSIQGMAHETLTLGHSAWETTYFAIIWDKTPDDERVATTHRLGGQCGLEGDA